MNTLPLPNTTAERWLVPLLAGVWDFGLNVSGSNGYIRRLLESNAIHINGEPVLPSFQRTSNVVSRSFNKGECNEHHTSKRV